MYSLNIMLQLKPWMKHFSCYERNILNLATFVHHVERANAHYDKHYFNGKRRNGRDNVRMQLPTVYKLI